MFKPRPTSISYPETDMTASQVTQALEYVSHELNRYRQHIHLICASSALPCLLFEEIPTVRHVAVMQAGQMPSKASDILVRAVKKASKKYGLGGNWLNTSLQDSINPALLEQVVYRSLVQNDVVFSSEGLNIIAIDHAYALKAGLDNMAHRHGSLLEQVLLLRRIVYISRGRPLTRGYIRRCYPGLETSDQMLLRLNAEYEEKYKARGVVGVNDEFMEWRREGLTWSAEMEEYRRELRTMIERDNGENMLFSDERRFSEPPRGPGIPNGRCSEVANIFANKKELFSAFAQ